MALGGVPFGWGDLSSCTDTVLGEMPLFLILVLTPLRVRLSSLSGMHLALRGELR